MLIALRTAKLDLAGEDKHWATSLLSTQLTSALASSRFRPLRRADISGSAQPKDRDPRLER